MEIKKIGVFTSGGDAPGMNAALRSVVRSALHSGLKVAGIMRGYEGMIDGEMNDMDARSVANIIQRGGTILKSARSEQFRTMEGRIKAWEQLKKNNIDALVAIGGDGTFTGSDIFFQEHQFPMLGVPGTIDNDLYGTDYTVGFDTAINTAVSAIDKIRDTAMAHDRLFIIEVMGRHSGLIAVETGIASGAGAILIPEIESDTAEMLENLQKSLVEKKLFRIIVVAEGDDSGGAYKIRELIEKEFHHFDIKVTILGHIQRGGNPTCHDRVLATRLGHAAVQALIKGKYNMMVGTINHQIVFTPFEEAISKTKTVPLDLANLATILS